MKPQTWVCLVLLSIAAAVSSCRAEGASPEKQAYTSGCHSSAQLTVESNPGRQLADRAETPPAAAAANERITEANGIVKAPIGAAVAPHTALQQAARAAGNATAPAPTPAEPIDAMRSAAASIQRGDSASPDQVARSHRSRRLGLGAARRAGMRAAAARRLGQRLHARPSMHSRRTATAAHQPDERRLAAAAAPTTTSSSSKNTTAATAAAAAATQQQDSSRLQAQKYFTITDLTGSKAVGVGTTLTWREGQLLRPFADSALRPADWKLVKVEAGSSNKQNDAGSEMYWVTECGYLQWLRGRQEVKYTAEVDSCSEVINYAARRRDDPQAPTQFGVVLIMIGVDNCLYSHCEQAGCGTACKCMSKATGECGCGNPRMTGFAPYYHWGQNRQSCAYNKITVVAGKSSSNAGSSTKVAALFEARRGTGNIVIPIRFFNTSTCLTQQASRRLQVHNVKCSKANSKGDASRQIGALPARQASPTAQAGTLQGGCNRADGIYRVVVGVPAAAGYYTCSVTFNDDWEDRPLAELRVM